MIDKDMLSYSIYLYIFKYNLPYLNTSHVNVNLYPTPTFLIVNLIPKAGKWLGGIVPYFTFLIVNLIP